VNVFGVQFDIAWDNKRANFEKVHGLLKQANPPKN